jgi:hypothetical protein
MKKNIIGIIIIVSIIIGSVYYYSFAMTTPIGKIVENPRNFDKADLIIAGQVTDVANLLLIKCFELRDKTGKIIVITSRPLPQIGSELRIKGSIEEAFSLGEKRVLVFIEK